MSITVTEYQHNLLGRDLTDKLGVLTINLVTDTDTDFIAGMLYIISLLFRDLFPSLISLMVSVDVKHHVCLLTYLHMEGTKPIS